MVDRITSSKQLPGVLFQIIAITTEGNTALAKKVDEILYVPVLLMVYQGPGVRSAGR